MQVTTLLSVMSSAVVVAALSSSVVQMQPTGVLVAAAPAVSQAQALPAAPVAHAAVAPAEPARPVAAPARPAYVDVPAGASALSLTATARDGAAPTVDVLACTTAWSQAGECLGRQAAVLRDAAVEAVTRAVEVPAGTPHLRVSVHGGEVAVAPTDVALPRP